MRLDNADFTALNSAANKEPRFTVELAFDTSNTDLHYFTSHDDTMTPITANVTLSVIDKNGISGTSQRIEPDKGLASIGTLKVKLIDNNESVSTLFNTKLYIGSGLRGKRVRVYMAFIGQSWANSVLIQTQIVDEVRYEKGRYTISCADIQRSERKTIFESARTNLKHSITESDMLIPVFSVSGFELLEHGASYTDGQNKTVLYLKIEQEVIRCTGTVIDPVLGLAFVVDAPSTTTPQSGRGALNTKASTHAVDTSLVDDFRKTKVDEYIYLELPVPKLIYAILTGKLIGQPGQVLPSKWHLGIDPSYVRLSDFTGIGVDIWDPSNDALGLSGQFIGLKRQDAKRFREKELNILISCFSPIYADGALGLRRMTKVLSGSAYVKELNHSNVVSFGALQHDMRAVLNVFQIQWNHDNTSDKTTRTTVLLDPDSITVHGIAATKNITLKGLSGNIHTEETLFSMFNGLRDRYAAPPLRLKVVTLPSLNNLEVGDIVNVNLNGIRDFNGALTPLNRPFEIQNTTINWIGGLCSFDLFASAQNAGVLTPISISTVLSNAFYRASGTNLAVLLRGSLTVIRGVAHLISNVTLVGGTSSARIYYYDAPLQINNNVTLTITGNVELRVRGHLRVNGLIDGVGRGINGTAPVNELIPATTGTPGYLSGSQACGSITNYFNVMYYSRESAVTTGKVQAIESFKLIYDASTETINGLPSDMRGTSGGAGGAYGYVVRVAGATPTFQPGGYGGNSGAALRTISRGMSFGGSGKINLSGGDGAIGTYISAYDIYAGGGAGGAPGCWLCLLDGQATVAPDTRGAFIANQGDTPTGGIPGFSNEEFAVKFKKPTASFYTGYGSPGQDRSLVAHSILYLQPGTAAVPDTPSYTTIAPTNLILTSGDTDLVLSSDGTIISRIKARWHASIDQHIGGYDVEYKVSTSRNWIPASNTVNLEVLFVYIAPVQDAVSYDVRVRAINNRGIRSDWLTVVNHTVIGKQTPPPDVDIFLLSRQADGTRPFDGSLLQSNRPVDFAGYEIRAGLGSGLTWDQLQPLHTGLIVSLPWETNQLSAGHFVAAIRAVDTSGNVSVNPKVIETSLGDPRINNAITTVDFYADGFPGIKTSCWVDPFSGELTALGTTPWSALGSWSAWTRWAMTWNPSFIYEHTVIDLGVVTTFTPLVTVTSNGTSIVIEESHSNDNITYSAFSPAGAQVSGRYIKIRITVTNVAELPKITQAVVIIDADIVEEYIENQNTALLTGVYRIDVGDIRLPTVKNYTQIKNVQITLQNVSAGWSWVLIDKDTLTAPRIKIYNASKILADANIDAFISGA